VNVPLQRNLSNTVGVVLLERTVLLERQMANINNLKKKIHVFLFNTNKIQAILDMIRKNRPNFLKVADNSDEKKHTFFCCFFQSLAEANNLK
jgi:hypothetical protein